MKKRETKKSRNGLRAEYDLSSLKGGMRGKHYKQFQAGANLALLAPDIRAAFPTDEDVDRALRSTIRKRRSA
jgi:hypothetical protein